MHDNLWNKALQENPEPERLYPVLAVGFGDLQVRSNAQKTEASRQLSKAAELSKKLADLHQKHDLSNAVRAHSAMMMQTRIHQRLLSFVKDTSMLIPALRGQSLTAVEDNVKALLENCDAQLNGAMGDYAASSTEHARLRAQMNELWAQLSVVRAKREASQAQGRANGGTEWVVVDESSFDEITHILPALQAAPGVQAQREWAQAIGQLLSTRCALFVSGFSPADVERDVLAFESVEGVSGEFDWLLTPGENVFASQQWAIADFDPRVAVKANWGLWAVRGKRYDILGPQWDPL